MQNYKKAPVSDLKHPTTTRLKERLLYQCVNFAAAIIDVTQIH
jgi:hypothetical protein